MRACRDDPEKIQEIFPDRPKIEAVFKEAQKIEDIVREFEGLAMEQERFSTEMDLRELIKDILDAWQPHLEQENLKLVTSLAETPLNIYADSMVLKVAVLHVLKNAVDASPGDADLGV